jgi:adenine-specific DNA-methyltransferase
LPEFIQDGKKASEGDTMPILNWLTRDRDVKAADAVPYRLLERDAALSAGTPASGNMLIQGDNLEALKSLLPYYRGQVKCIYIDPPYNTRSAFEHYDDNLEHSQWLAMMWPRLELLRELLSEDGSIWVSIDDNEGHYLKVVMDEVFGRGSFLSTMIWRKNYSPKSTARHFSEDHDYIMVYARSSETWLPNLMPRSEKQDKAYRNQDNDPRGPWKTSDLSARNFYSKGKYRIVSPTGRVIEGPPGGNYWRVSEERFWALNADDRIWWGKDGTAIPQIKRFLSEVKQGVVPQTFWPYEEVGHTQDAKKEILALSDHDVFVTPKPERLLQRILHIATNPGDFVLDSFLGSGTTAAVAHKMGRRWIGIEMGDHAVTHCQPRLAKVVAGEQGGISQAVGWEGGGGFDFYRLGPAVFDADGTIASGITFAPLAAHVWFAETETPFAGEASGPFLGVHDGQGLALLYNGILGDKRPAGGNVLTRATLALVRERAGDFTGPLTVYGEASRLSSATLAAERVTFKQTPYDVKAR